VISRLFKKGLQRRGVECAAAIEASSLELVTQYVADGQGIGVNVDIPGVIRHPRVRVLPLEDFAPMEVAALWHGPPGPLLRSILEEGRRFVHQLFPAWQCDDALE
jgi:DNA-binding transcriptional LysR family regulator